MPYDPTPMGDQYYPSIRWDERGNPYQLSASGKRQYVPPVSAATANPTDPTGAKLVAWAQQMGSTYADPGGAYPESGFASNRGTWNGEQGTFDRGNFFNTSLGGLLLGGGMIAAPYVAGALAGGAGGGAGTDAAVTSATAAGTGPATTASLIPAIPTTEGIASATSLGLPVTEGLGTAGAIGGAAAAIPNGYPGSEGYAPGNTFPNGIPNATQGLFGLDPKWSPLLKTLAGVGGLIGGNVLGDQASQQAVPPQLTQLLDLAMQRANSQTPLYNAVNKGFYDMLPNFAKGGQ